MRNVYLSIPVKVDWDTFVKPLIDRIDSLRVVSCQYWHRGTRYTDYPLVNSKYFVLFTEDNSFKDIHFEELSVGTRKELNIAIHLGLPIMLAYKNRANEVNVYATSIDKKNYTISAIGDSTAYCMSQLLGKTRQNSTNDVVYEVADDTLVEHKDIKEKNSDVNESSKQNVILLLKLRK